MEEDYQFQNFKTLDFQLVEGQIQKNLHQWEDLMVEEPNLNLMEVVVKGYQLH